MILKYFKKSIFYLLSVSIIVLSNACEDDPLLEPQSDRRLMLVAMNAYLSDEDMKKKRTKPEVY